MHPRRSGLVLLAALVGVTLATLPGRTRAAGADATAQTDPTGAHVELDRRGTWLESVPHSGSTTAQGCPRQWIPSGAYELRKTPLGDYRQVPMGEPSPGPDYSPYQVWCADTYLGTVWIRPQQFGVDPRVVAERLVRDLPYPPATVGANPRTRGLTGLETWFWVDGYTAAPITDVVTELGMRVEVEATPDSASWDFGDGTTMTGGGLGSAPPNRSGVTHTFEVRARPTFPVRSLLTLTVRWRLNGGPWQALDPVVRTARLDYPVVESRAALIPG